jgi:hypothetical protein
MTVTRKPDHKSTKETVKTIACGNVGRTGVPEVKHSRASPLPRGCGCSGAPGVPHALFGRKIQQRLGRFAPRDLYACLEIVIASEAKQSILLLRGEMDCFAEPVIGAHSRDPLAHNDGLAV